MLVSAWLLFPPLLPAGLASHRYTALVDPLQGASFEPDGETTSAVVIPPDTPIEDRTVDVNGDSIGDASATVADLGNGNTMLDAVFYYAGTPIGSYLHVNGYLRTITGSSSQFIYPGADGLMAWFGLFDDKNGNLRIDDQCPAEPGYSATADEFQWRGAGSDEADKYEIIGWVVPGNHTGFLGDWPDLYAWPGFVVYDDPDDASVNDPNQVTTEDPLGLTAQSDAGGEGSSNQRPDFAFDDRSAGNAAGSTDGSYPSGCPGNTFWVAGNGFSTVFGDNALIRTTVVVAAVFADGIGRNPLIEQQYDLALATYADVDLYQSANPQITELYEGLAATSRGQIRSINDEWCTATCTAAKPVMEVVLPAIGGENNNVAAVTNRLLPPAEHEPTTPEDQYPGASWGGDFYSGSCGSDSSAQPRGSCNDYQNYAGDWHLWLDVQGYSAVCLCRPFTGGPYGPVFVGDNVPSLRPDRHSDKTFTPGHLYDFRGNLGQWFDKNADTWIGDVRGTTTGPSDPYFEGLSPGQDPNDYNDNDPNQQTSEFRGLCIGNQAHLSLVLEPVGTGGLWPGGLLRFNQFETIGGAFVQGKDTLQLILSGPVVLPLECLAGTAATSGLMLGRDYVAFVEGSALYTVRVTATASMVEVTQSSGEALIETVVDTDYYSVIV